MKKNFYRFLLLNKRLYKKPVFVIILALIPLLMFSFGIAAKGNSGLVRIALAQADKTDAFSGEIINGLLNRDGLIFFTESASPESAIDMVKSGKADAAWIFPDDTLEKANVFAKKHSGNDYIVDVYQREQTIPLRLAGEVLSNEFFRHCSRSIYVNYIHKSIPELAELSDSELLSYYDEFERNTKLFDFSESENDSFQKSKNYLLAPLRGLLSVLVLLCGLAATLFFIQDKQSGTFSLILEDKLPMVGFICQLIAILNIGPVMLISLFVSGLSVSLPREILTLLFFSVSCASFCSIIHLFVKNIKFFGALIPLFIIVSVTVCPVFFDFGSVRTIQLLLPPTHYINAAYDNIDLMYQGIYCAVSTILFFTLSKLQISFRRGVK